MRKKSLDTISHTVQPVKELSGKFIQGRAENELPLFINTDPPEARDVTIILKPSEIPVEGTVR